MKRDLVTSYSISVRGGDPALMGRTFGIFAKLGIAEAANLITAETKHSHLDVSVSVCQPLTPGEVEAPRLTTLVDCCCRRCGVKGYSNAIGDLYLPGRGAGPKDSLEEDNLEMEYAFGRHLYHALNTLRQTPCVSAADLQAACEIVARRLRDSGPTPLWVLLEILRAEGLDDSEATFAMARSKMLPREMVEGREPWDLDLPADLTVALPDGHPWA
jgi:hypothetical protein